MFSVNIVVIVQARIGSTRLPGKVMLKLEDKTVLAHVIERCRQIMLANEVVIATTVKQDDDLIEQEANRLGVYCHRGSEDNVLHRYYEAAQARKADVVVRVTSDCPLLDPEVANQVIAKFIAKKGTDYCSNTLTRTYPQGLDVEVFSFSALERAFVNGLQSYEQEHVTPYLYQHPEIFELAAFVAAENYSQYRWTLDTQEDWLLIQEMYRRLYVPQRIFSWSEALRLMQDEPQLQRINHMIQQKKLTD
jgi:spore coat polysaccharide biosynthesis protein SpsF